MKKLIAVGHNNTIKYVYGNETVVIKKAKGGYFLFVKDHYSRILDDLSDKSISKAMQSITETREIMQGIEKTREIFS